MSVLDLLSAGRDYVGIGRGGFGSRIQLTLSKNIKKMGVIIIIIYTRCQALLGLSAVEDYLNFLIYFRNFRSRIYDTMSSAVIDAVMK